MRLAAARPSAWPRRSYDGADRLVDAGVAYDSFGRTTTVPAGVSPSGGVLSPTYYVNDLVAGVAGTTWTLDQTEQRLLCWTVGSTTKTNHYDNAGSDSPAWIEEGGGGWTVNVTGLLGGLGAVVTNTGAVTHEYANLHGDTAATCAANAAAPTVGPDYDEYGNTPTGASSPGRYGWLGAKERSSADAGGLVLMGVRLYDPIIGRFLFVDPVVGGNLTPYDYVGQDPINAYDVDGRVCDCGARDTTYPGGGMGGGDAIAEGVSEAADIESEATAAEIRSAQAEREELSTVRRINPKRQARTKADLRETRQRRSKQTNRDASMSRTRAEALRKA